MNFNNTSRLSRRRVVQAAGATGLVAGAAGAPAFSIARAQDGTIEINFWNWWDVGRQPLMDAIIAEFQEENPGIVVNNVPQTWDRRDEIVVTALSGGDPPQVLMASRQEIVRFADAGALVPIEGYVEEHGIDLAGFYESELESMWWKDHLYALPMPTAGGESGLYFYNIDMLTEAGLDPDNPPSTWEELDEAAGQLTVFGDDGGIEILGINLALNIENFIYALYCNNGSFYSDDLQTVTFNSDEGIETLNWIKDFVDRNLGGHQNWLDWGNAIQQGEDRFHQQRQAMQFQNVSQFFHIKNQVPDLNYGVHFRPYNGNNPDAGSHGVAAATFGWGYVIPTGLDPEVEEAAFKFVMRITAEDSGACNFMVEQERPSPLIACNENPTFSENNPHWDKVVTSLENDISIGIVPVQSQILSTLGDYIEMVGFDELSPEDALHEAAEEAQGILDDYWASAQ